MNRTSPETAAVSTGLFSGVTLLWLCQSMGMCIHGAAEMRDRRAIRTTRSSLGRTTSALTHELLIQERKTPKKISALRETELPLAPSAIGAGWAHVVGIAADYDAKDQFSFAGVIHSDNHAVPLTARRTPGWRTRCVGTKHGRTARVRRHKV